MIVLVKLMDFFLAIITDIFISHYRCGRYFEIASTHHCYEIIVAITPASFCCITKLTHLLFYLIVKENLIAVIHYNWFHCYSLYFMHL